MRKHDARQIFRHALVNRCSVCHAFVDELCDTPQAWVCFERIVEAGLDNDEYFIVATLKQPKTPDGKTNLGDLYSQLAASATNFNETFEAFNRMSMGVEPESRANFKQLYVKLSVDIRLLVSHFHTFGDFYEKDPTTDEAMKQKYIQLADAVKSLERDFSHFSGGFDELVRSKPKSDSVAQLEALSRLSETFTRLAEQHLRFSLEYNILRHSLLRENMLPAMELLSAGFGDHEAVTQNA